MKAKQKERITTIKRETRCLVVPLSWICRQRDLHLERSKGLFSSVVFSRAAKTQRAIATAFGRLLINWGADVITGLEYEKIKDDRKKAQKEREHASKMARKKLSKVP